MRRLFSLLTFALVAMPAAPAGARSVRPTTLGTVVGQIVSDGAHWAAWSADEQTTRILDTRAGTLTDVTTPQSCRPTDSISKGVTAIGGGQLAWTCTTTGTNTTYPTLLTLRTMRVHLPAGLPGILGGGYGECYGSWVAVGRRWVRGRCEGHTSSYYRDLDWRRGASTFTPPALGRHDTLSLNTTSRKTAVCAPIIVSRRKTEHGIRAINRWFGVTLADRWVLGRSPEQTSLELQACGSRKIHALTRCRTYCGQGTIGGGWVSWTTIDAAYARRLHRRTLGPRLLLASSRNTSGIVGAGRLVLAARLPHPHTQTNTTLSVWRLPGAPVLPAP